VEVEEGINNRCKKFRGLHIIQEELKYINRKKKRRRGKASILLHGRMLAVRKERRN
jgi:hypothetical protein